MQLSQKRSRRSYEKRTETRLMSTMMSMSVSVRAMIFHFIANYLRRIASADSPYLYYTHLYM